MNEYSTWTRYGQSKLANILFTKELARQHPALTCVAVHPGGVATNLMDQMIKDHPYITTLMMPFWKLLATPADRGAWNQVWAATGPVKGKEETKGALETKWNGRVAEVESGCYFTPITKRGTQSNAAGDAALAEKLWEWTEEQLVQRGY